MPADATLQITASDADQRLDKIVAALPGVGSRKRARMAIETGKVKLNERWSEAQDLGRKLQEGDTIELHWNRRGSAHKTLKEDRRLRGEGIGILYADDDLVAIDKPPGMLTDAATEQQQAEERTARNHLDQWLRRSGDEAVIVHRIDRLTSGAVMFARNAEAGQIVHQQFLDHSPERVYLVIVAGGPLAKQGTWTHWLRWDQQKLLQTITAPEAPRSVQSSAHWRVQERFEDLATLIEVRLVNGRRNQIRLQCQASGYPVLGERQYRDRGREPYLDAPRQALHAHRLTVEHPSSGEPVSVESPVPADMRRWIRDLRRGRRPRS